MNNLNELAKQFHERSKEKGFWDKPRETGTLLMLIVSELSEALEADRKNRHASMKIINQMITEGVTWENSPLSFPAVFERDVKDTFEDEIADTFIRLFDLVGSYNIDIEKHIEHKMQYNQTRPYKHAKAY
mgnify:CR=1 FL=1